MATWPLALLCSLVSPVVLSLYFPTSPRDPGLALAEQVWPVPWGLILSPSSLQTFCPCCAWLPGIPLIPPPLLITLILSLAPPGSLLLLCLEPSNLGMLFSKLSYMDRSRGQERQENGAGRSGTGAGSRSRKWEHDTGAGQEHHARMSVPWACPGLFAPLKARVWAGRG